MSSLHIHKDFFAEAFWKKLNSEMKSFLKRVKYFEICYTDERGVRELVKNWESIPEGIKKRMANRILQGDKDFLRESTSFSNVYRGLYAGIREDDIPIYNNKSDAGKIFRSSKRYPEQLKKINGWPEYFSKHVLPFKAWLIEDQFFELNEGVVPFMKELIESHSGKFRPGIVIFDNKRIAPSEAKQRFLEFDQQFFENFQRSTKELGISVLFRRIHSRVVHTNTGEITLGNSIHSFWNKEGNYHNRATNDYIDSKPGFMLDSEDEELFASREEYLETLLNSKPICFGYPNWKEILERYFVKTS